MIKALREFRLIPLVLLAAGSLLVLKAIGLVFDGGYLLMPATHQDGKGGPRIDSADDVVGFGPGSPIKGVIVSVGLTPSLVSPPLLGDTDTTAAKWLKERPGD